MLYVLSAGGAKKSPFPANSGERASSESVSQSKDMLILFAISVHLSLPSEYSAHTLSSSISVHLLSRLCTVLTPFLLLSTSTFSTVSAQYSHPFSFHQRPPIDVLHVGYFRDLVFLSLATRSF